MRANHKALLADTRGQVLTEYLAVFIIIGFGLVTVAGPLVGPRIMTEYARRIALLYATYP